MVGPGARPSLLRAAFGTAVAAAALALASPAAAAPGLLLGLSDDGLKHDAARTSAAGTGLGVSAFRVTLRWSREQRELTPLDRADLDRVAIAAAGRFRIVLSVFGAIARDAPRDDGDRADYCQYVRNVLVGYPAIRDVVIWNEPNKQYYW